jgi:hypothetical protein
LGLFFDLTILLPLVQSSLFWILTLVVPLNSDIPSIGNGSARQRPNDMFYDAGSIDRSVLPVAHPDPEGSFSHPKPLSGALYQRRGQRKQCPAVISFMDIIAGSGQANMVS